MLFSLEVLKAHEGDCLLLHWGSKDDPRLAVIDGGPVNIYETSLRPRLDEIRRKRGLAQLPIELVMVSHIDNDHVVGVKKLFAKLADEVRTEDPDKPLRVERLWHNTFDDIVGNSINAHYDKFTASFEAAAGGAPKAGTVSIIASALVAREPQAKDEASEIAKDIALVLAGHGEGRTLRDDASFLFKKGLLQRLNKPFGKALITADLTPNPLSFLDLKITIAGPLQDEIEALQKTFDDYLTKHNLATGQAALAAYADTSVPNLSSMVCLVEHGGKSILLTGDARGDRILEGLRKVGRLGGASDAKLHVDILKAPHHGSDRNTTLQFFQTVTADDYVFSGDGKYGNPERDTVDWVIKSRAKGDRYRLIFTYPIDVIDKKRESEAKHWDAGKDSLRTLLDQRTAEGHAFTISDSAPVVIDLASDKVAF